MRFFKTRFFYICLTVAIVLTLVPILFAATGNTYILKNAFNTALTPVKGALNSVAGAIDGYARYFGALDELRAENEELLARLEEYRKRVDELEEAARDYEWLSDFMDMKKYLEKSEYVKAGICGTATVGGTERYTIDVGSMHGIKKGMSVLFGGGVLGKVTDVGLNWATVCTPLDSTVSFGARCSRSLERGYTEGDVTVAADGTFYVRFLSTYADIVVGDTIVSVGGEWMPDGLALGTVERVEHDEYDRTTLAVVRPSDEYTEQFAVLVVIENDYEIIDADSPSNKGE